VDVSAVRHSDEALDLRAASRDLWPGGTLDDWQRRPAPHPARVWWPTDEEQVLAVLRAAVEEGREVVPYGAGSGVCGGARGKQEAWVVDTKALQRIGPLDEERMTVRVQAGVNGQHLEDWLRARGFTLGHSPSSIWCSTVGGWAAARSAGQFSSRYGVFEDMVLSLRGVAPAVGVFEVGPDGDAPDEWLEHLLGSEGTLAVLTEVELRVWPVPERRWLRGFRADDIGQALEVMRALMQAELWPSVVRLYDPVDTRIGGKTKPKSDRGGPSFLRRWLSRVERLPEVRRRTLALPLGLPGLLNQLVDGLASGCLLVVGFEGDPAVVEASVKAAEPLLAPLEDLGPEPGERWFASRHAVSFKLMPVFERGGFADTMEVAGRWSQLQGIYDAVREAVRPHALVMAHMSHVYPEGGCIYFSFAGKGDRAVYTELWKAALGAVLAAGGTVTHHHGVGALKAEAASREAGAAVVGHHEVVEQLDPSKRMNPGRLFVQVDVDDAGPPPLLPPGDGLVRASASSPLEVRQAVAETAGVELMWPFEQLPGPARWHRCGWQQPWIELTGRVDGVRVRVGRGPRSASGPDLRGFVARQPDAEATMAVVPKGERWMGEGRCEQPWAVARQLLRSDLRPAVLTVVDGRLLVGFRGPAAEAFGALASQRVPGGLQPVPYAAHPLPAGPMEPCEPDDPDAVSVTPHDVLKRRA
jgi:alkyldihydroxyacetonephosphate synthase